MRAALQGRSVESRGVEQLDDPGPCSHRKRGRESLVSVNYRIELAYSTE